MIIFISTITAVFKIFEIKADEEMFLESTNLRVAKNMNLNFSCNDVAWNPINQDLLATGATNGAVVTWNLAKVGRSKMDLVFPDHKRTVNTVCFHPIEPSLLVSCSQDGTIKLFDLRKKDKSVETFNSGSQSVRDIQFSPHHVSQYHQVSSVQENGNVQMWDFRRGDRPEKVFTAHNGPVFSCDWHPVEKKWLATAGRDKSIKVWDLSTLNLSSSFSNNSGTSSSLSSANTPALDHHIQTIAPVARVRWRPDEKFDVASSSLVFDFSVSVWDIRRPFIPFVTFNEHKDVTKGFVWINHDTLISTGKDNTLYHHFFEVSAKPLDSANPIAIDISVGGHMGLCLRDDLMSQINHQNNQSLTGVPAVIHLPKKKMVTFSHTSVGTTSPSSGVASGSSVSSPITASTSTISSITSPTSLLSLQKTFQDLFHRTPRIRSDSTSKSGSKDSLNFNKSPIEDDILRKNLMLTSSSLLYFPDVKTLSMNWFIRFAQNYQLTGLSFAEICSRNSRVSSSKPVVSKSWLIISQIFATKDISSLISTLKSDIKTCMINRDDGRSSNEESKPEPDVMVHKKTKCHAEPQRAARTKFRCHSDQPKSDEKEESTSSSSSVLSSSYVNVPHDFDVVDHQRVSSSYTRTKETSQELFDDPWTRKSSKNPDITLSVACEPDIMSQGIKSPTVNFNFEEEDDDESSISCLLQVLRDGSTATSPIISGSSPDDFKSDDGQMNESDDENQLVSDDELREEAFIFLESKSHPEFPIRRKSSTNISSSVHQLITSYGHNQIFSADSLTQEIGLRLGSDPTSKLAKIINLSFVDGMSSSDSDDSDNGTLVQPYVDLVKGDSMSELNDDLLVHSSGKPSLLINKFLPYGPNEKRTTSSKVRVKKVKKKNILSKESAKLIQNLLKFHASAGDVQTAVCLLIVLNSKLTESDDPSIGTPSGTSMGPQNVMIDDAADDENVLIDAIDGVTQEKWFSSYIELLSRFQLWSEMTQVITLSKLSNILQLNQSSTSVNLCCGMCGKLNHSSGPFVCQNCKTDTSICCLCQETVYGLYVWCQGCSHGGHLDHLMQWFLTNQQITCPVDNCNHKCQFD